MDNSADFTIVGGGIVGFATACELQRRQPTATIMVVEKEAGPARHQSGRNSGVIHAGVYYQPGSLKAELCKQGNSATIAFCQANNIAYQQCGKLLVASNDLEQERMQALYLRAQKNEIEVELLGQTQLLAREPNIKGLGAIWVPASGIVSYRQITEVLAEQFQQAGGKIVYQHQLEDIVDEGAYLRLVLRNSAGTLQLETGKLIACAGIYADDIVRLLGLPAEFKMIPFRGEYYRLPEKHNAIVNHLIYPIPDPELPFLGVHLTKMIDGGVTVGPNAVLAPGRKAYSNRQFKLKELAAIFAYPGSRHLFKQQLRSGLGELWDSVFPSAYLRRVQKFCPHLQRDDLLPYPPGIRAQAVRQDGTMVDDFLLVKTDKALVVANAPSPAATSALPIATYIVDQLI